MTHNCNGKFRYFSTALCVYLAGRASSAKQRTTFLHGARLRTMEMRYAQFLHQFSKSWCAIQMPRQRYGRFYTCYQIGLRSSEENLFLPVLFLRPSSASPWGGKAAVQRLPRGPPQPERYERQQVASTCPATARAAGHGHSTMRPAGSTEEFGSPPAGHIKPFNVPRAPCVATNPGQQ